MRPLLFIFLFAVLIAGCSKHAGNEDSGRIAAVVNGVEITQREVEYIYQRGAVAGTDEVAARNQRRNILSGLVRAELLAQQGAKMGLEKSPEYLLALHDSRRRALAGLAQEKLVSDVQPVTPDIVQRVIDGNPNLFGVRKLFVFDEVVISGVDLPLLQSLNVSVGKGASLADLLDAVKVRGFSFQHSVKTMTSDQIQPAILKVLSDSKSNVPVVIRVEDRFSMILMLHSITPVPIEGKAATDAATKMIVMQRKNAVLMQKLAEVLDASKITYFGEYKTDSAGVKSGIALLPTADRDRAAGIMTHRFRLAVSLGIAFMGLMLLLFMDKTVLTGKVWKFPLRIPVSESNEAKGYDYDVYEVSFLARLVIFLISGLALVSMGYQLVLIWSQLPFWVMALAVFAGLFMGIGSSNIFSLSRFRRWTYAFRWFLLCCFFLIVIVALLVTMRIIMV